MRVNQPGRKRHAFFAVVAGAMLFAGWCCWDADAELAWANQSVAPGFGTSGWISHFQQTEGRPARVIIIDPRAKVMGVYEINPTSGGITLKSSRNLSYDLQMLSFNSEDPSPEEIKKTLDRLQ